MMAEIFDTLKVEGVGTEIINALLITTLAVGFLSLIYFAWKTTSRRPLEFDIFLVEMHTMSDIRLVEVLYVAPEFDRNIQYATLQNILRYRASQMRPEDGRFRSISDTNIVIQSPESVSDPYAQSYIATNVNNALTLYDIEMPVNPHIQPHTSRDSQLAASVAITILGRSTREQTPVPLNLLNQLTTSQPRYERSPVQTTLVQLQQYTNPIRRRIVGYPPSYRTPISVRLNRNSNSQSSSSNSTAPYTHTNNQTNSPQNTQQRPQSQVRSSRSEEVVPKTSVTKQVQSDGEAIKIRLKFLDDTEKMVETDLANTVLHFKRAHFPLEVQEGKVIRLIFRGKLLREDNSSLGFYGLHHEAIVHCHISTTPYVQYQNEQRTTTFRNAQEEVQRNMGQNSQDIDRTNVWFFRLIFNLITNQITSLPIQLQASLRRFLLRNQARLQPSEDNSFFPSLYRRFHHILIEPFLEQEDPVALADAAAGNTVRPVCISNYLLWIFGIQCAVIWMFVSYFPQLCDRTAFGLLLLLTLYFFFVVVPMPYRRQVAPARVQ